MPHSVLPCAMKPLYIFIHLAKTGGTTFVGHLYHQLGANKGYFDLGPHGTRTRQEEGIPEIEKLDDARKDAIQVVGGHLAYWGVHEFFPNREARYVTFVREPVSRVISHYTFDMSKDDAVQKTFKEWYKTWIPNQMCAFYMDHLRVSSMDEILERFTHFWHIAFTPTLDNSLKYILTEMKLPLDYTNRRVAGEKVSSTIDLGYAVNPVLKDKYVPTPEEIEMIKAGHEQDTFLYEHLIKNVVNGKYIAPKA